MKRVPILLLGLAALAGPASGGGPPWAFLENLSEELRLRGGGQVGETRPLEESGFGPGTSVTVVKPAAFLPGFGDGGTPPVLTETGGGGAPYALTDFATLVVLTSGTAGFWAPVDLPNGATIERVCLVADESDSAGSVNLFLVGTELDPTPSWVHDPFDTSISTGSSQTPGWTRLCVSDLDIPVQAIADADGDGGPGLLTYSLLVAFISDAGSEQQLGGVEIDWRRTLSPAPSTATFDDVSTDHLFFQQIEALAASSITGGCDADNFCPGAPLTRAQMAAFLASALGLHWPN